MPPRVPLHWLLAAIAFGSVATSSAAATSLPAPTPPTAVVSAGDVITTMLGELPPGVDEVELFLVPASGPPRMIRVSAETAAGHSLLWRMPEIAESRVRLVLRAGTAREEFESAPSAPFDVAPAAPAALANALQGRAEDGFVLRELLETTRAEISCSQRLRFEPGDDAARAVERSPSPGIASPRAAVAIGCRFTMSAAPPPRARVTPRTPRTSPLRI